jgi:ABC-2 type transport system ATP-binding protein
MKEETTCQPEREVELKDHRGEDVVVRASALRKEFDDLVAVDDFNLEVKRGSIYGLVGPNAAGKTTAIRMMIGKLRPTSGQIKVLGLEVPAKATQVRPRIGVMPQALALYSDLTARENLIFFGALQGLKGEELQNRIEKLGRMMKLEEPIDRVVNHLSGGTVRRVSLACALIHSPELLFLDEPTVGIDPVFRDTLWTHLTSLRSSGVTILLTTHYLAEAENCDTVGMMREGRIILEGDPTTLKEEFAATTLEEVFIRVAKGAAAQQNKSGA